MTAAPPFGRPWRRLAALLGAAAVGGCASPDPRLYTLADAGPAGRGPTPTVAIGPVTVPALVDRPQLVLDAGSHRVRFDEFSRWAAPLADDIAAAIAAALSRQLDSAQVWVRGQAARTAAEVSVALDVQRFELAPGAAVRVEVLWTVRRGDAVRNGHSAQQETPTAPGVDAAVAAQARALARVGDDIARAIGTP